MVVPNGVTALPYMSTEVVQKALDFLSGLAGTGAIATILDFRP